MSGTSVPIWDQRETWADAFLGFQKKPPCSDPMWSPATDDALREATMAALGRRNIIGVLGGTPAMVQRWRRDAPDHVIPACALPRAEFSRDVQRFVDAGFGKRVMFGSDQMVWPGMIEHAIRVVEEAPSLTPDQKRDILYNNAARFLRLTPADIERHHGR